MCPFPRPPRRQSLPGAVGVSALTQHHRPCLVAFNPVLQGDQGKALWQNTGCPCSLVMGTNVIGDLIQLLEVSIKERMIRCLLCLTQVPSLPPFISSASCSVLLYLECWDEEVDEICSQQAVLDIKRTAGHQGQFSGSFPPSELLLSLWKGKGSGGEL